VAAGGRGRSRAVAGDGRRRRAAAGGGGRRRTAVVNLSCFASVYKGGKQSILYVAVEVQLCRACKTAVQCAARCVGAWQTLRPSVRVQVRSIVPPES